jgi:hypothetical protein
MILDLEKIWKLCNILSDRQCALDEQNCYVQLLGNSSEYFSIDFESFLEYYSFKIEDNNVVVFNCDGIPYEDYSNNDYSYIPLPVLGFGKEELENYVNQMIEMQLKEQEKTRIAEKENIKRQIERLQKQLDNE